jgi:hypothetical protein
VNKVRAFSSVHTQSLTANVREEGPVQGQRRRTATTPFPFMSRAGYGADVGILTCAVEWDGYVLARSDDVVSAVPHLDRVCEMIVVCRGNRGPGDQPR